ncbi:MAG: pyridoxal-phosphate dependent enzyme [Deltaproteobacteria bacterium]|nr:pyridoxal-phosphate dependent enzyme [Deltaproteobacteria bacterium]
MSHLTGLACIRCGASFGIEPRFDGCPECRREAPANLTPRYDLDAAARTLSLESLRDRPPGMRRYRELLPPDIQDAATLGEGETPLLHCTRYGRRLRLDRLYLKDESQNPSGSFKDRLAFTALAMARRFGAKAVGVSSTGNAGAAAAAYAARAGLPCIVLTVQGAASAIVTQMQAYGAMVVATRTKADRWKLLQTGVAEWGWYPTSPYFGPPVGSNPYGVEGYKTLAYEVCEQMDWEPPDWCVLPVAYGDALFGMWKGFDELARLGLITKRPRMVAAEMAGCLTAALASGEDAIPEMAAPSPYVAGSISVNQSTYQALHALRASDGAARVARNDELLGLQRDLAADEGIYAEPSSLAALAAVGRLCEEGRISRSDTVVVVNTASGLKDTAATAGAATEIPTVGGDIAQFLETLEHAYGFRAEA